MGQDFLDRQYIGDINESEREIQRERVSKTKRIIFVVLEPWPLRSCSEYRQAHPEILKF